VNSIEGGELLEDSGVSERNVDHAVVSKGAHGSNAGGLLTATETCGGNEETSVLAPEGAVLPLTTGLVPEYLELSGEVT
jgi:hypothetical protein